MSLDLLARPWAMEPRAFQELMLRVARADGSDPKAFFFLVGQPDQAESDLEVRSGVAVVRVRGALFRESSYVSRWALERSYVGIRSLIQEALDRTDVSSIVLDVDSPGGEAFGLAELSDFIYAARAEKRIEAVVRAVGASAAYFIASSASAVYLAREAMMGSIGTIMVVTDWSEWDAKQGIKEIHIVSTQSPRKDPDPTTDAGLAQLQEEVDAMADVFVGSVARNRGVTAEIVLSRFGQGGVFIGEAAVAAGLADGVATLDEVVDARAQGRPVMFERPLPAAREVA